VKLDRTLAWCGLFLCITTALGATPTVRQDQIGHQQISLKPIKPSEDDLILLSVVMASVQISDEMEGYRKGSGVVVPLAEICRLLEIAVKVDLPHGKANGFVGRTSRVFSLDLVNGSVKFCGKSLTFDSNLVEIHPNDIFIDTKALNTWLELGITFDSHGSGIAVNPKDPLPLLRRLQREDIGAQLGSGFRGGYQDPGFPQVPNPYQAVGDLAIDQSFSIGEADAMGSKNVTARYTAQFSSDFARASLNGFIDLETDSAPVVRLAYGWRDPDGGLLGSMHARDVTIGDVQSLNIPLVSEAHPSTGIAISNAPLFQSTNADSTNLEGALQTGWDVELFRGEALLGYQQDGGNGRYVFRNVPLYLGANRFRLVFNGPLGERREEDLTRDVVGTLAPGALQYSAFLGGSSGAPEWAAETDIGLKRDLAAFSGIAGATLSDGSHIYTTVGMRGYFDGALVTARVVEDPSSGQASQLAGMWNWGRASIKLSETAVNGLESNVFGSQLNADKDLTQLQLNNLSLPAWSHLLPAGLDISREETTFGTQDWSIQGRLAYQNKGLAITHLASWETQTGAPDSRSGEFLVSDWRNGNSLQGSLGYRLSDCPKVTSLSIQTSRVLHDLRAVSLGIYESPQDGNVGIAGTLRQDTGPYSWGLSLDLSKIRGLVLGMNISFGAVRNPTNHAWVASSHPQSNYGAVLVHVFLANGRRGLPMTGVAILINDSLFPRVTGSDGTLLIDGLIPYKPTDIRISETSLENPLLICSLPGLRIKARPGRIQRIEMPIVATGEVSGTISTVVGSLSEGASGVMVTIVDSRGKVVREQRTAFDGFYTLSRVPVGAFTVKASAFGVTSSKKVVVPPEGAFIDGIDIVLPPAHRE